MKKIVYIISTLKRTGPTNILAGIALNLDKSRFKPVIVTLSPEEDGFNSWKPELETAGIEIYSLNLSRLKGIFTGGRALKRIINAIKPDIIHTHCFRSTVFAALYSRRNKRIATIHCDYETDFSLAYGEIKGFVMSKVFSWALGVADKRVCCSKMLADLLARKHPNTEYMYVDNGVDTQKFSPTQDKSALRRMLNLPEYKKIFIWAGAFIPRKDPATLAQAVLNLKEETAFFIFCGEGPLLEQTKNTLKGRKNVLFTGQIPNIQDYFKAADFYVSTSLSEGLPCTVLEALSCDLPILLTDIPQHQYIFVSQLGSLFPCRNEKELCQVLQKQNQKTNSTKFQQGHLYVKAKFSTFVMTQKYQNIYIKLSDYIKERIYE
ncbi:MAG: glycosyltransferase [Elusimicrobia bacterium]|nr:glycosyltransferase [Elusimicrobiota bacterium]